ncbi:ATP-binding protein [Aspergillus clavatus NRRL 1]|uniref:AAA family ATPase, putative n=1 Tax=Aspergillus clavatus (strain ATCC 1007 / CBS 513.65 / DSM 816 / NCTC 3887 / NRRL 1 / QM 1276 / 107) TaxID=344612 RepID=A1CE03_ASPCL|nr:AAA family ATPase, putative [Aspergillus clavatus NRRL 1]EAW12080.1 AAA family ATPase, putative [Aspergillus clavatus NRRL 1]
MRINRSRQYYREESSEDESAEEMEVILTTTTDARKDGQQDANDETAYVAPGSICEVHNLYQTKRDENGRTSWTKEKPGDLHTPAEDSESAQYALLVRHVKCYDGRKPLKIHSIIVQSDRLRKCLGKVLCGYPSITMTLERVEFRSPFEPFVHRWKEFTDARDQEGDSEARAHLDLLHTTLEGELRDTIARKNDLVFNGVVTHDLLWTIFEPHDDIFSTVNGRPRAFQYNEGSVDGRTGAFQIDCQYVDLDGDHFGFRHHQVAIPAFTGTVRITELPVFPLRYHQNNTTIRDALIARGKLWEQYKGYHFKYYEGLATGRFMARSFKFNIKSRIIIDTDAFNTFNPDGSISVYSRLGKELTDHQRLLATCMLQGYSLKDKRWLEFDLSNVKDIVWDSQAFDSLVLPENQQHLKQLILALTKAQSKQADAFDDVVQGKGRGIIMQLSGPPGVGKTLTAESVAEVMQAPLYVMSAGDLGSTAEKVEDALKDILRMVPKWGAVLLLDEADVFMEARTSSDLERNELVSIFLRMLEYYEGILFLTTNRAENIDPAFESRIHVSIVYPDLEITSRRHIWSQFLTRTAGTANFSGEQLDSLAAVKLNGRQIKNVVKTAHLLSWSQEKPLAYEHVQTVLNLRDAHKPVSNGV